MQTESISHSLRTTSVTRSDSLLSFFLQRNIIYIYKKKTLGLNSLSYQYLPKLTHTFVRVKWEAR